jgi:hypothetical protein
VGIAPADTGREDIAPADIVPGKRQRIPEPEEPAELPGGIDRPYADPRAPTSFKLPLEHIRTAAAQEAMYFLL